MVKSRCVVWKDLCKINFNLYDTKSNKKSKISFDELSNLLLDKQGHKLTRKRVVVNGGHFIPNLKNQDKLGKSPLKTWELACQLVEKLRAMEFDAYISLMINDLPFTPSERKRLTFNLPKPFKKLMEKYGLSYDHVIRIMTYSNVENQVYIEKKLANRFVHQKASQKWNVYGEEINNYCIQAIIAYFRDIIKQGANVSIWISPKCAHENLIKAIKIFNKKEKGLRNICYFETDNCFL